MTAPLLHAVAAEAERLGWTRVALRAGLAATGRNDGLVESAFPAGPVGAIAEWIALVDSEMAAAAVAAELQERRVPERVRWLIEWRLRAMEPRKLAVRRAATVLALPWNAGVALRTAARTADAIWLAAGDRSADFSWYTRRASLGAIHAATLAYWLRDSADLAAALAFLDRRLADLARLQRRKKATA